MIKQTRIELDCYDNHDIEYIEFEDLQIYFKNYKINVIEFISDDVDRDYYTGYSCNIKAINIEYDDTVLTPQYILDVVRKYVFERK